MIVFWGMVLLCVSVVRIGSTLRVSRSWGAGVGLNSDFLRLEGPTGPLEALSEWPGDGWMEVVEL